MVKLSRLTLQGFKSFKNKTSLVIGDGITCIAGSNGSGKSNILDAFSFVLGKNSAKALRADRMEDLIFKSEKGQSDSAKVELEIDNSDREIKFDENTIVIERKINTLGQSTYRLNNRIETRQRILDLLREARISPDWLNIVAQGDVTRILEMNPLERRHIIDELAGLAEFDEKKKKSETELKKVDEILKEQSLLLKEREKLFQNISVEKRKVETYNELNSKIKKIKFSILKKTLDEHLSKKERIGEKAREYDEKIKGIDKEIQDMDKTIEELENKLREYTKNIFRGSEEVKVIEEQEKVKSEIMKLENKINLNNREKERLEKYLEQISEINKPKAIKFLLGKEDILGTVEQILDCDQKYKQAIDVALGNTKNDIIIKSFDKIPTYIKYLKENKIGRAKFLSLDKIKGNVIQTPEGKGIIGNAINLVSFDEKFRNVVEYALGNTIIIDKLENSKPFVNKYRIATLEGSLIEKSGAVLGGYKEQLFDENKIRKEIRYLTEENKNLEKELEKLNEELKKISKKREETSSKYAGIGKEAEKIEEEIRKIQEKRRKIYERKLRLQSELSDEKIKLARIEVEVKNYQDELSETELFDEVEEGSIPELKEKLRSYAHEINKLGPLNWKSVEDFEKYRSEYEDLKEKVEKIIEEKYAILKVITEIENRRKEKFMDLFEVVNKEFGDIYSKFTGGEGYIVLEEPGNIYSGLLIKARPKGKRLLGIDSLSGGEKTITAIGFLLAIQRCRPSCFVLLDEIDAALDSENTKKIIEAIREFSKEQQYIIITHNDVTISKSDQVYGVVSENGISSIVGIKINQK